MAYAPLPGVADDLIRRQSHGLSLVRFLPLIRIGLLRSGPLLLLGVAFPRLFGLRGGTPVSALARIVLRRFFAHAGPPMDAKLPIGQSVPNGGEAPIPSHIRSAIVGLRPARP